MPRLAVGLSATKAAATATCRVVQPTGVHTAEQLQDAVDATFFACAAFP